MALDRLLVTGAAGFIGSNFAHYWHRHYPQGKIIIIDALTYAGNKSNLKNLLVDANVDLIEGDICDRAAVESVLKEYDVDTLVHFAAESHVDRSISEPEAFVRTNVLGTFTLLEAFRSYWEAKHKPDHFRFLHVSTDEVYGSLGPNDLAFSEITPYSPNSPYSATKAGSDHLARAYYHTYGMPTLITNCSNNYGPYHFPEKLIPLMCVNMLLGKPLPIYGDGQNVRDWLFVEDHCSALDSVLRKASPGETYNIGGQAEVKNIDLVNLLCELMNELAQDLPVRPTQQLITYVKDRPGHDRRYAMDISKIRADLGWQPSVTLEEGLRKTVKWYLENRDWWMPLLSADYQKYYEDIYKF
ncbi:dTDP-glucose 4,6-dehydratase [Nodosilinea sp. LEGE 07088]|uniref:dTDP-glucose 4,6-dehydratase n=1 Tax=Nodosilinea sp. LEGE 07088 TaxID=2777968 RepID=UPI0018812D4D|nr:dTDP-glucose 4,6-dehydratase [Nodosilinea sp. LEGE 07088]MBE9135873.1 dTDP-glucose 4,6-dehydratase [Nodosilinea sp. LEGE 07088]